MYEPYEARTLNVAPVPTPTPLVPDTPANAVVTSGPYFTPVVVPITKPAASIKPLDTPLETYDEFTASSKRMTPPSVCVNCIAPSVVIVAVVYGMAALDHAVIKSVASVLSAKVKL